MRARSGRSHPRHRQWVIVVHQNVGCSLGWCLLIRAHDQYGNRRVPHGMLRHTAEPQAIDTGPTVGCHDNQGAIAFLGGGEDRRGGVALLYVG